MTSACLGLELTGITKRFPGVIANDDVDLSVRRGEIHAIVGENGAGKSTLMSVLYGLYQPDEGSIRIDGTAQSFASPLDAMDAGIGMVFQHFQLFGGLTVTDNVVYREEPRRWRLAIDRPRADTEVNDLAERFGLAVDPHATVDTLSVGERQRVEILKALYRNARILILDEPTAVLTPQETDGLMAVMRRLRDDGRTIVFITHKLREVMELADRATVLRRGRVVAVHSVADTSVEQLSAEMIGREVDLSARPSPRLAGDPVLAVRSVSVRGRNDALVVNEVSFEVAEGEIVGIAAIAGNGQEELIRALAGLTEIERGEISVLGIAIESLSVESRRDYLIAYVPEDRHGVGTAPAASIAENLLLGFQRRSRFQRRGWLNRAAVDGHAASLINDYSIKVGDRGDRSGSLSGGNLQKVVIARELAREAPLLIAEQPTRGVDVGAIEFIHAQLVAYRDQGGAVLLQSAELSELMTLSTRIVVMYDGAISAVLDPVHTTEAEIGLYMTGASGAM